MSEARGAQDNIVAVVTLHPELIRGGGALVFTAPDGEALERMAILLSKMTGSAVHDLERGTYVIVRHG